MPTPPPLPPQPPLGSGPAGFAPLSYQSPMALSPFYDPLAEWWTQGNLLLVRDRAVLPQRCVKCNSTYDLRTKAKTFVWVPPLLYLLLLFPGLLIGGIIILCLQKRCSVSYSVCATCRSKSLMHVFITLAILLGSIGSFVLAGVFDTGWLALLGVLLILTCIIYGIVTQSILKVTKIDEMRVATLKGVSPDLLREMAAAQMPSGSSPTGI